MTHMFHFEQAQQEDTPAGQGQSQVHAPTTTGMNGFSQSTMMTMEQLTRIFTAAICALVITFFFFIQLQNNWFGPDIAPPLLTQAGQVVLGGAVFMLGIILCTGIPLALAAWRSTPRIRFLLAFPFLTLVLPFSATVLVAINAVSASLMVLCADLVLAALAWRSSPHPRIHLRFTIPFLAIMSFLLFLCASAYASIAFPDFSTGPIGNALNNLFSYALPVVGNVGNLLLIIITLAMPILCTWAINRAMRQATIPDGLLRFARLPSRFVVFALVVMCIGLLSWGFYLALFYPDIFFWLLSPFHLLWNSWLLMLVGLFASLLVAVRALSSRQA